MIDRKDITGLVLAGGKGSRMGGVDKGLQLHHGVPLALHALRRLAPQVGRAMLNANRNHADYLAMGVPVWSDCLPGHAGPLAGFQAGLAHCATPWLATVPCDSPFFPEDTVRRLAQAAAEANAEIAIAATREHGRLRAQPVFCLMRATMLESLVRFTQGGRFKVGEWTAAQRAVEVAFDDPLAFANANTADELRALQRHD